jgi:hypothetical protein
MSVRNSWMNKIIDMIKMTPSFRQAPECPLEFLNVRVAGALKGLSVIVNIIIIILIQCLATFIRVTRTSEKIFLEIFS